MRLATATAILLAGAGLVGCESPAPPSEGPPLPAPAAERALAAAHPSCALRRSAFAPTLRQLIGTRLGHAVDRVEVDRTGRTRWNGAPVDAQRLGQYLGVVAGVDPPTFISLQPAREAPCTAVREALAAAAGAGRCTPQRCAFEWQGSEAPPPPPLPERAQLIGKWVLVSIDGAPPPAGAPPIELIFTDGEVGARSQCVGFTWLTPVEKGRLRLRIPVRPVAMCARGLSGWETRFQAAMAAAARIDSDGRAATVTGDRGVLKLQRPA